MKKITNSPFVQQMSDSNSIFINAGNELAQMTVKDFREHLNDNDEQVLHDLAFYIDVNKASSLGSARVDVGGNLHMRALLENSAYSILMDSNGNATKLNRNDNRYTEDGTYLLNEDGSIISTYANCDFMKVLPETYGRVQTVTIGATTVERLWLSPVPLPGGYIIPQQVVGKFKCSIVSSKLRSIPAQVPANNRALRAFWDLAQAKSKNHGIAGLDFRNHLLFHMMSKYAYRDSQGCVGGDGTLVWGVGLDGTENNGGFDGQKNIKTGLTLSLGDYDGNVATTDANSNTCHCVSVAGFENPWGQYWEMIGGLCSVGSDVYHWRGNFIPPASPAPTADTFANIEHTVLTRATTNTVYKMNIIASENGQGVYMIPNGSVSGVTYNDFYSYAAAGQLWLFGGASHNGSKCGLAYSSSNNAWSYSNAYVSARLAYFGNINLVSSQRLAELQA